jgi:hypothetical protein
VNKRSEFQTAVVRLGRRNYGYISPGAAPPGVTRVDPTKIFNAIVGAGYAVVAWAHTHWDNNLLFSGADMQFVYKTRPNGVLFMANSQGNSFRLDYGELRSASSDYRGANGVMQFILSVREIQGEPIQ